VDYIDGYLIAVPEGRRNDYIAASMGMAPLFKENGATAITECWGDDVPDGQLTSFPMAVKAEPGEVVVIGWITWPSRAVRDEAWPKIMQDPRMTEMDSTLFDGKRMVMGGFEMIVRQ
jgi:uncharacterized protein YbaA (DUF1428 family)